MGFSGDPLRAGGYGLFNQLQVSRAGRTFDAVAKSQNEFEVVEPSASQSKPTYSPPINPARPGIAMFMQVAAASPSAHIQTIDLYV